MARNPHLIGMLHLPPLPGSPRYGGDMEAVVRHVLKDAAALVKGGLRSLMMENFGDAPFYPAGVPGHVIAHMAALAVKVKERFDVSLGVNVLRNDGCAAMAVAHAAGADFIRVNILCGARLTDQGIIQGIAHDLLRLRKTLGADRVRILADVNVKHSAPLAVVPLEREVADLIHRGLADALIVTGGGTGEATSLEELKAVKRAAGKTDVYVGSGIGAETVGGYLPYAEGFIVGSWLKRGGDANAPVDLGRAKALVKSISYPRENPALDGLLGRITPKNLHREVSTGRAGGG